MNEDVEACGGRLVLQVTHQIEQEKAEALCAYEAQRMARFAEAFGGRLVSLDLLVLTDQGWLRAEW